MPAAPVSVTRGKNAARAAPMLAFAACSSRSARRMSGRSSSTSDGRPAGTSARRAARLDETLRLQRGRHRRADDQGERVLVLPDDGGETRGFAARAFQQRARLGDVQRRRAAGLEAARG